MCDGVKYLFGVLFFRRVDALRVTLSGRLNLMFESAINLIETSMRVFFMQCALKTVATPVYAGLPDEYEAWLETLLPLSIAEPDDARSRAVVGAATWNAQLVTLKEEFSVLRSSCVRPHSHRLGNQFAGFGFTDVGDQRGHRVAVQSRPPGAFDLRSTSRFDIRNQRGQSRRACHVEKCLHTHLDSPI